MRGTPISPAEAARLIEDVLRDHVFQEGSLERSIDTFAARGDQVLYLPHGIQVPASDLCKELKSWRPQQVEGDVVVYHGTSRESADFMLENGVIPQMKPWTLSAEQYAAGGEEALYWPSQGLERGLYVTSLPRVAEGFGYVVLALRVLARWIKISAEVVSHGYYGLAALDVALRSADGAIISEPIHPDMIEEY